MLEKRVELCRRLKGVYIGGSGLDEEGEAGGRLVQLCVSYERAAIGWSRVLCS